MIHSYYVGGQSWTLCPTGRKRKPAGSVLKARPKPCCQISIYMLDFNTQVFNIENLSLTGAEVAHINGLVDFFIIFLGIV